MRFFSSKGLSTLGIELGHYPLNEPLIGRYRLKVQVAPQVQRLAQASLEIAVARFNAPVLMGDAGIVAGGVYPVVPAQLFVKLRQRFAPSPPLR